MFIDFKIGEHPSHPVIPSCPVQYWHNPGAENWLLTHYIMLDYLVIAIDLYTHQLTSTQFGEEWHWHLCDKCLTLNVFIGGHTHFFQCHFQLASRFSPVPLTLRSLDLWTQKLYCAPLLVHCPPCTTGPCIARFLQSSKADCGNKLTIAIELKSSFLFPKGRVGPYQQPALPPNRTGQAMSCFVSLQTDFIFENTKN